MCILLKKRHYAVTIIEAGKTITIGRAVGSFSQGRSSDFTLSLVHPRKLNEGEERLSGWATAKRKHLQG